MSSIRELPRGDEESFRLVTGFNDIFVTIGVIILLVAVASIVGWLATPAVVKMLVASSLAVALPSAAVAATAWPKSLPGGGAWRCPGSSCPGPSP